MTNFSFLNLFLIYLFWAALSLCCCTQAFSNYCLVLVHRLLIAGASLIVEYRL